ncbi:hypothetical protein BZG36_02298 [Bifiguratus adelaidae]|uniref:Ribosome biogenesis protein NSA1 n=1 Tax=Bifiguratus adelaidae TaxID=1938954 RepID=A0A261Y3N6_9FUNG|nr:hypothetical protein BZG36_02298 [Bifiguratus adelaidae]
MRRYYTGDEAGLVKVVAFPPPAKATKKPKVAEDGNTEQVEPTTNVKTIAGKVDKTEGIVRMAWSAEHGKKLIVVARKSGKVDFLDVKDEQIVRQWRDENIKGGSSPKDPTFVGLYADQTTLVTSTSNGHTTYTNLETNTSNTLSVPMKPIPTAPKEFSTLCRSKVSKAYPNIFAIGGKEYDLNIFDMSLHTSSESASTNGSTNGTKKAMAGRIFEAKNVKNDWLDLRVPIWITDLAFLNAPATRVVTCTGHSQVRLYDTKAAKRPVRDFLIGEEKKRIALTHLCIGRSEHEVIVTNNVCDVMAIDLRNGKTTAQWKGPTGSVTDLIMWPGADVEKDEETLYAVPHASHELCTISNDRFLRVHETETQFRRVVQKAYLKQKLSCVLVEELEDPIAQSQEDEDSDKEKELWEGMATVGSLDVGHELIDLILTMSRRKGELVRNHVSRSCTCEILSESLVTLLKVSSIAAYDEESLLGETLQNGLYVYQLKPYKHYNTAKYANPAALTTANGMGKDSLAGGNDDVSQSTSSASTIPDFVKKLYRMLSDDTYSHIVSWGSNGSTFVVKEPNEFAKHILPKHFKHSNFASFVRQLNKYDFHKLRNGEEANRIYGEQAWEFHHPKFQSDKKDLLEEIKRKTSVKPNKGAATADLGVADTVVGQPRSTALVSGTSNAMANSDDVRQMTHELQTRMDSLQALSSSVTQYLHSLSRNYQTVVEEMLSFRKNMQAQDNLMKDLVQYLVDNESAQQTGKRGTKRLLSGESVELGGPDAAFVPSEQARKLIESYSEVQKASLGQMNEISKRVQQLQQSLKPDFNGEGDSEFDPALKLEQFAASYGEPSSTFASTSAPNQTMKTSAAASQSMPFASGSSSQPGTSAAFDPTNPAFFSFGAVDANGSNPYGLPHGQDNLTVFTVGHLTPRKDRPATSNGHPSHVVPDFNLIPGASTESAQDPSVAPVQDLSAGGSRKMRVHRGTFIPGWSVPPKVLLVEDDAVCRTLSSKLLQVFGCTFDVAVDGVDALQKLNLEKYDIVLMDIVMPNLDGVTATSRIRQFDTMTPIISMTSNTTDSDIMTYFNIGMNDILPKPFSRQSLYGMLEKYCAHLKEMQRMQGLDPGVIHRSLGELGMPPPQMMPYNQLPASEHQSADHRNGDSHFTHDFNHNLHPTTHLRGDEDPTSSNGFYQFQDYAQIMNAMASIQDQALSGKGVNCNDAEDSGQKMKRARLEEIE